MKVWRWTEKRERFARYMLDNCYGAENRKTIKEIADDLGTSWDRVAHMAQNFPQVVGVRGFNGKRGGLFWVRTKAEVAVALEQHRKTLDTLTATIKNLEKIAKSLKE